MPLSPELEAKYEEAAIPFIGGAISAAETKLKSWRYFLEVNSVCNLRCPTCTKGNQAAVDGVKYEHQTGIMEEELMERILDKIASENPNAIVFAYSNSEPMLHPRLPECIASIKRRGLNAQLSTNLNYVQRLDDLLDAKPDFMIVSLSGFTQDIYVRGHAGGNIDRVKANMVLLSEANITRHVPISVNFHRYNDNEHEIAPMKEYSESLGLGFFTSYARAISMENAIRYCQKHDPESTPFEVDEGRPDWNTALPKATPTYEAAMQRLKIPPTKAREMYAHHAIQSVCPVGAGSMFTHIRHDGKTELCACVADRRIVLADFLDATPDQLIESRTGHAFCKQCIHYRLNLYFHIADRENWGTP